MSAGGALPAAMRAVEPVRSRPASSAGSPGWVGLRDGPSPELSLRGPSLTLAGVSQKGGYWQREAESFAEYYQDQGPIRRVVSRFLDSRTRALEPLLDCGADTALLDLGCGSGVHLEPLAGRCREVVGVDCSPQMLAIAERKLAHLPRERWRLQVHDVEQPLPFPDRCFDWVISLGLLDYVSSPGLVMAECHRILKDAGRLVFTIPKRPSLFGPLRTAPGNLVKRAVFNLPPVRQVLSRRELERLLDSTRFQAQSIGSIWTTMWIVKASKSRS